MAKRAGANRALALREARGLYKRVRLKRYDKCFYCDFPAECQDHVPPVSLIAAILRVFPDVKLTPVLVPACAECNNLLKDDLSYTPKERLSFLAERYGYLIGRFNSSWTDEEIAELGYNLKNFIKSHTRLLRRRSEKYYRIKHKLFFKFNQP